SGLERRVLKALRHRGLPQPQVNVLVHNQEADLYWRDAHLIVELDGTPYHRSPRELKRDRSKDPTWTRHGETARRFTDDRVDADLQGAIEDIAVVYSRAITRPRA